jgi:hypothetical protein
MKLSAPKATRETLPVTIPTPIATTPSITFHATVNHSRSRPRRCSFSLRAGVRTAMVSRGLLCAASAEQPEPVESHGDGGAHVGQDGEPQRHQPEGGQKHKEPLD